MERLEGNRLPTWSRLLAQSVTIVYISAGTGYPYWGTTRTPLEVVARDTKPPGALTHISGSVSGEGEWPDFSGCQPLDW
jgi:hypothetical protein